MKYQASLPEHNDNISHEHPLRDVVRILVGLSATVLVLFWLLGVLVDHVVDGMSAQTEARLTQLMAMTPPESEPALASRQAWLQGQVDRLRQCAGVRTPVVVRVSDAAKPNAVVVPGGTVIVFKGLFDAVQSENGMAFVLAHELAHLAQRDHLRAIGRQLVLVAAAVVVTGDGSGAAGLLAPAQYLGESRYSRGREASADAHALATLACRYGHVGGADEFFTALRHEQDDVPAVAHYLATHPSMAARIEALQQAARAANLRSADVRPLPRF